MEKTRLFEKRWDGGEYNILDLTADKSELKFDGVHGGKSVEEHWGDSDYEFWRTIKAAEYPKLLVNLIKKCYDDGLFSSESDFNKFCKDHGIDSSFWSYA